MNYFKELKVWQKAIDLVTETYRQSGVFPKEEWSHFAIKKICRIHSFQHC